MLEEPDRSIDWLLIVRSIGMDMTGAKTLPGTFVSCSGNRENQSLVSLIIGSPSNIGEHSKLPLMKGESSMSGEVKFVNAVDGGTDPKPSVKISLGDTVRVVPAATEGSLIAVNADTWSKENPPLLKLDIRLAPESKELLLFKSAGKVSLRSCWRKAFIVPAIETLCSGMLLLEFGNSGTGGRWRNSGCWNSVVDDGAEFA